MCISVGPTNFSKTTIYSAEVVRKTESEYRVIHVLGYQNRISSSDGPNAMLLPFPAKGKVGQENLVNGKGLESIMEAYAEMFLPDEDQTLGETVGACASMGFEVFQSGSYTVALVQKATALPAALRMMPSKVRPQIGLNMVASLNNMYPGWPIALCCFSSDIEEPEPLFWWYEPKDPGVLFAPALDAHDGNPPLEETRVQRDHTLVFGSDHNLLRGDLTLAMTINDLPTEHQWLFTQQICGGRIDGLTRNGDFYVPLRKVYDMFEARERYIPKLESYIGR